MPTYDYECRACGHAFERFQGMNDRKLRRCPSCGRSTLVRLVGAGAGLIFRGSGFYETDYKRAASPAPKEGKDGDAGAAAPKDGTTSSGKAAKAKEGTSAKDAV